MVTKTMSAGATPSGASRAPPQGGILEGGNPSHYDPKNPIILFIIQAGIILILCRLLHFPLSRIRQPRVIAEVIAGILLGPSVMGRIPDFRAAIFPDASMPALTLAGNLGLVLFLFLVGLEVDLRFLVSNWRIALSVGAAGMAMPFGLGCAIAWGLYHQFHNEPGLAHISFGVYMLFIGVAMAITAFPVLCRILTELKLLATPVGVIVLSAGVGNDVVGWILLALCVALVNSGTGITALWVLLVAFGYTLFLVFALRPAFLWILRRTGSIQNGPTQAVVALTVLLVLASAFFTGVIGIHPIFGAFMIGLLCPHDGGFAVKLTEKIEDLVSVLFLPLYFALSGLSTNLGLLNSGITWAYVVGVIAIAFFAKIAGGTLASKANGLVWRESLTIGVLMSCKGLVELIVLNIGLQAKILSTRTFTIFVVMALVTTFATTPLTSFLYPKWYQTKLDLWKRGKIDWDGNPTLPSDTSCDRTPESVDAQTAVRRVLVYLRLDGLPSLFKMIALLSDHTALPDPAPRKHHLLNHSDDPAAKSVDPATSFRHLRRPLQVHGLRLVELTERASSVMAVSEVDEYATRDPIVKSFRTFGDSNHVAVAGSLAVIPEHSFASTLLTRAEELSSDLILIPWSETGSMGEQQDLFVPRHWDYPFENRTFSAFVSEVLHTASSANVGILIDHSILASSHQPQSPSNDRLHRMLTRTSTGLSLQNGLEDYHAATALSSDSGHHIIVPFFGGADDIFAVRLALQLTQNEKVTVTIIHFQNTAPESSGAFSDLNSATENASFFFTSTRNSLPEALATRVVFEEQSINNTIPEEFSLLISRLGQTCKSQQARDTIEPQNIVIAGRGEAAYETALASFGTISLGVIDAVRRGDFCASLMVVQARKEVEDRDGLEMKK